MKNEMKKYFLKELSKLKSKLPTTKQATFILTSVLLKKVCLHIHYFITALTHNFHPYIHTSMHECLIPALSMNRRNLKPVPASSR